MKRPLGPGVIVWSLLTLSCGSTEPPQTTVSSTNYDELTSLFQQWRPLQEPDMVDGVPDYRPAAMARQRRELARLQRRLASIDPKGWTVSQQVDYHIVQAEMNGLDFDHRVLRPWARDPCFYRVVYEGPTDVPAREGPHAPGAIRLWEIQPPLSAQQLTELRGRLQAIPKLLEQAKANLTIEARDLWRLGIRVKQRESAALEALAAKMAPHHPAIGDDVRAAKAAVDDFRAWLEKRVAGMTAPSGVGRENYDWYMSHVHLVPYTWEEQVNIIQRELQRAWAHLKLTEARNNGLPELEPPATEEQMRRRFHAAVDAFMAFVREKEFFTLGDYMNDTLRSHGGGFVPPGKLRDFFAQVDHQDSLPMRAHGMHWFDLARMEHEPHFSPIRRVPLLYNIWDSRAEGLATGMEEMAMHAGLFDERPRARELVYILLAMRCARAMGDLMMHANEWGLDEAVDYAVEWTPRGWLPKKGQTIWFDEQLYLEQPGYGTSYVIGKIHIEKLMADRARQLGAEFHLRRFMDEFHASGMIPVSLIRWEITGLTDEMEKMQR